MHQAPHRWFIDRWARRAAGCAMLYIGSEWTACLEWPRAVLDSPSRSNLTPRATAKDYYSELVLFPFLHYHRSSEGPELDVQVGLTSI
ncbi:hypothetical protein F4804DRAFT_324083, partial [Jackrogersella minutella]